LPFAWIRVAMLPLSLVGIGRWRALIEPMFEFIERVGQTPFIKNGAGHGGHGSRRRRCAGRPALEQPLLEYFGIWIFSDGTLQQFAFDRQANAIRRLVALAVAPEPVGRIERSKQSGANLRRTNY
jgi:hypothetical protein